MVRIGDVLIFVFSIQVFTQRLESKDEAVYNFEMTKFTWNILVLSKDEFSRQTTHYSLEFV